MAPRNNQEERRGGSGEDLGDGAGAAARDAKQADVLGRGEAAVGGAARVAGGGNIEAATGALAEDDSEAAGGRKEEPAHRLEKGCAALQLLDIVCRVK